MADIVEIMNGTMSAYHRPPTSWNDQVTYTCYCFSNNNMKLSYINSTSVKIDKETKKNFLIF